jgi:NAD(P)-dependent dehydrogenase (short-subunit alcohol dehydrogenase family)
VIFTKSLDSKLRKHNIPVQVHAVHPGIVNTELFNGTLLKTIAPWIPPLVFKVTFLAVLITPSNVMVRWLAHQFCVWKVLGSSLFLETSYPDCDFSVFSYSVYSATGIVSLLGQ